MVIRVREGKPPSTPVDSNLKEKMKLVMAKRYIAENKALDLSSFVKDPGSLTKLMFYFKEAQYFYLRSFIRFYRWPILPTFKTSNLSCNNANNQ